MYRTFISTTPSNKRAGVGFLPVPKVIPPVPAQGTFTSGSDNTAQLELQGVVETVENFEVGDNIIVDSAEYPTTAGQILAFGGGVMLTDIVFTVPSTGGTILQVL